MVKIINAVWKQIILLLALIYRNDKYYKTTGKISEKQLFFYLPNNLLMFINVLFEMSKINHYCIRLIFNKSSSASNFITFSMPQTKFTFKNIFI